MDNSNSSNSSNSIERKSGSKMRDAAHKLCGYTLKTDYDMKLEIYKDESATQPECSHSFTGSSKKSIVKTVALIAVGSVVICLISSLCSFFSKLFKK